MFYSIKDFKELWEYEVQATSKIFTALTDSSLDKKLIEGHWTLGETAWHIVMTIPEMMNKTGLSIEIPGLYKSSPKKTSEIIDIYHKLAGELLKQIEEKWTNSTLEEEDDMYGEKWKKSHTLMVLIGHQTHHRGQMTVLMRLSGLQVPGVYGPSKEEWNKYGMEEPPV